MIENCQNKTKQKSLKNFEDRLYMEVAFVVTFTTLRLEVHFLSFTSPSLLREVHLLSFTSPYLLLEVCLLSFTFSSLFLEVSLLLFTFTPLPLEMRLLSNFTPLRLEVRYCPYFHSYPLRGELIVLPLHSSPSGGAFIVHHSSFLSSRRWTYCPSPSFPLPWRYDYCPSPSLHYRRDALIVLPLTTPPLEACLLSFSFTSLPLKLRLFSFTFTPLLLEVRLLSFPITPLPLEVHFFCLSHSLLYHGGALTVLHLHFSIPRGTLIVLFNGILDSSENLE